MLRKLLKISSILFCFLLIFEQSGVAQVSGQLDISGKLAAMRPYTVQDKFRPLHLRYLQYDPQQDTFRLLLDKGDFFPSSLRGAPILAFARKHGGDEAI